MEYMVQQNSNKLKHSTLHFILERHQTQLIENSWIYVSHI
jgi:hypothetical protein